MPLAREIVQLYEQKPPLSAIEKRHLFDVYKLSILIDCIWFFGRGDADTFYEKSKIDHLNQLGREQFCKAIFELSV